VLSGWFYGILLLALFILATRVIMGPARTPGEVAASDPAAVYPAVSNGSPAGATNGAPNGAKPDATRVNQ
jgi:hypothetical protein